MWPRSGSRPRLVSRAGSIELALVLAGFGLLAAAITYPLLFHLGSIGYKAYQVGDAQYSIWNVAWVAHALLTDPRHVLDANIFYPHPRTLIFSEANLAAGALAVPVYFVSHNPFAAHNSVVLLSFVLSGTGTYYLVRYLVADRRAAVVAGISFALCPYVFGHLPHIQLLMTAGIPFSLLAFHRLADRPSVGRGATLGVAMGLQGLACAYYAVFVAVLIGYAVLFTAMSERMWRERRYWLAVLAAAVVSSAIVLPLFSAYVALQRDTGFGRELGEATNYAATWSSYLTSSSRGSGWIYPALRAYTTLPAYTDQLFPGAVALILGLAGIVVATRAGGRTARHGVLYASIVALAFWESLGPSGGLYSVMYALPGFSFLRAPSRFGVMVAFGLAVLAGVAIARLLTVARRPALVTAALIAATVAEQGTVIPWTPIEPISPAYHLLASQPDGAILEMPPRSHKFAFTRTQYMINSTAHWKPLVNAYSDFIPDSLYDSLDTLAQFPSRDSFALLARDRVRYVAFDLREYRRDPAIHDKLAVSLQEFAPYLHELYQDDRVKLFEIVGYPAQ
ncbi:MAG TPA: hypothetical protein VJP86_18070 [Vicinamibacterales bacterium]|nr:hypothetical protein [Vicinamibacterales bacterium]